jgi:NitT/TauT family transport system substrate-binding protein
VKQAYKELGKNYESEKSSVVDPAIANAGNPAEIWHAREGLSSYPSLNEFLKAVVDFRATGAKLNATYVYDKETGLKLFGKTAFYVKSGNEYSAYLRKPEAEDFAKKSKGSVMSFEDVITDMETVASL